MALSRGHCCLAIGEHCRMPGLCCDWSCGVAWMGRQRHGGGRIGSVHFSPFMNCLRYSRSIAFSSQARPFSRVSLRSMGQMALAKRTPRDWDGGVGFSIGKLCHKHGVSAMLFEYVLSYVFVSHKTYCNVTQHPLKFTTCRRQSGAGNGKAPPPGPSQRVETLSDAES